MLTAPLFDQEDAFLAHRATEPQSHRAVDVLLRSGNLPVEDAKEGAEKDEPHRLFRARTNRFRWFPFALHVSEWHGRLVPGLG